VYGINPNEPVVEDPGQFYHPVAFSFFLSNSSTAVMAFCYSTIDEHNVTLNGAFSGNYLVGINDIQQDSFVRSLGFGPSGLTFNGTDVSAVIGDTLTDAIWQNAGGGVFNYTSIAVNAQYTYLRYQALLAPLILVVGPMHSAIFFSQTLAYRLEANPLVAHFLTGMCVLTGVTLLALFLYHHMRRGDIQLGAEPSRIATILALLSEEFRAKTNIHPRDSLMNIEKKLNGFRFKLLENGAVDVKPPPKNA